MGRRSFLSGFLQGHVGIRENSASGSAAKGALDVDVSDELPFSDFRPLASKYVRALATRVGRVSSQQPVYRIFSQPNDCISYSCWRGDCDFSATHQSLKYDSHLFFFLFFFFSLLTEGRGSTL